MPQPVTIADVEAASRRIASVVKTSPLIEAKALSRKLGRHVWLKVETAHPNGAFKLRGAANTVIALAGKAANGVVAASTGNHGLAIAHVARRLGLRAVIFLPQSAARSSIAALKAFGAELRIEGVDQTVTVAAARAFATAEGMAFVHPFDDPLVVAGQGTIGLEIVQQLPDCDAVVVPISGGGLAAGIAVAVKARAAQKRVIGVCSARNPAMLKSLEAGKPVDIPERESLAHNLAGSIGLDNHVTFPLVRDLVDAVVVVEEDAIAEAMAVLYEAEGLVAEGAGAAATAALLRNLDKPRTQRPVAILSGRNVDPDLFKTTVAARAPARR